MKKTSLRWLFAIILGLTVLSGCAGNEEPGPAEGGEPNANAGEKVVLKVGATPVPHAEILQQAKPLLQEQGIELDIVEFTDYVLPNQALNDGDLDANFFQHAPYMEQFNAEHGTKVSALTNIHFEPLGLYGGKQKSLDNVPEGANFAVPNDPTNEARALQLIEAQGLIKVREDAGLEATPVDITENPKKIVIKEFDAAMLPRMIAEVDYAVVNGNYAIDAGLSLNDALASESKESLAAKTFANILAVREGENRPEVNKLAEALQSEEIRKFIEEKYQGSVVPMF